MKETVLDHELNLQTCRIQSINWMKCNHKCQARLVLNTPTQPFSERRVINQDEGQTALTWALSAQNVNIIRNPVRETWLTLWFQSPLWPAPFCAAGAVWWVAQLTGIIIILVIIRRPIIFNHLQSQHTAKTHVCAFTGDVKLNVTVSKVTQKHEEDPSSHPSFQSLLSWRLRVCVTDSPLWVHGCRGGTDSSNGGGGTLRLLGVQARCCDERFCRLWIQASMIVHEGCTQPGETCWGWAGKLV